MRQALQQPFRHRLATISTNATLQILVFLSRTILIVLIVAM